MRHQIFVNIKRWLMEYGIEILDHIIQPVDKTTRNTDNRYNNFRHELNRHFSSEEFYQSNFESHLPLLTVGIHNIGYSSQCYCEYMVVFKYHWQTISADGENTGENTPEALMETIDAIGYHLAQMMKSTEIVEGVVITRNLFKDLQKLPNFEYKMFNVAHIVEYPTMFTEVEKEINSISKQFKLTIGECG